MMLLLIVIIRVMADSLLRRLYENMYIGVYVNMTYASIYLYMYVYIYRLIHLLLFCVYVYLYSCRWGIRSARTAILIYSGGRLTKIEMQTLGDRGTRTNRLNETDE